MLSAFLPKLSPPLHGAGHDAAVCIGVTVAMDTEEAKAVEEANRRYGNLLHTKQVGVEDLGSG